MNAITNAPGSGLASSALDSVTLTLTHLPAELLSAIVELLGPSDLKNLRLANRELSRETRPFLSLASFSGMSWRNDMSRLHGLSGIPECAARIRSVKFVFAAMDEYRAYHDSFAHMFGYEPEVRTERLREMWVNYQATQVLARRNLRRAQGGAEEEEDAGRVESMGSRAVHATTKTLCLPFPVELVGETLERLPNLRTLIVTWTECPWSEDVERVFDPDESVRLQKDRAREIQRAFMRSLWTLDAPLEMLEVGGFLLTADDLHDLDCVPANKALTSLRTLEIEMANLRDELGESREQALGMLRERMESLVIDDAEE